MARGSSWRDALIIGIVFGGIPCFIAGFIANLVGLPFFWRMVLVVLAPFIAGTLFRVAGDYVTFGKWTWEK